MRRNRLMGDAAAALRDVRSELNCLTTKAEGYLRTLAQASSIIRDSIGTGDSTEAVLPPNREWPSVGQIDTLCDQINEARTRQHNLTQRMREWGVIQ